MTDGCAGARCTDAHIHMPSFRNSSARTSGPDVIAVAPSVEGLTDMTYYSAETETTDEDAAKQGLYGKYCQREHQN